MNNMEKVELTPEQFKHLIEAAQKFWSLQAAGVDNWEAWDEAMKYYKENYEETT